jgi:hypothetical protein
MLLLANEYYLCSINYIVLMTQRFFSERLNKSTNLYIAGNLSKDYMREIKI